MPNPTEPRPAEDMAVTLVRIETGVTNVLEKVSDLRTEVTLHRGEIRSLQSTTQQIESDMKGAEEARKLAAAAVKAADEARVAAAKAQVDNSTQRWTPAMRLYATLGALASVAATLYYITHPHG